jgi:hypothetical protein
MIDKRILEEGVKALVEDLLKKSVPEVQLTGTSMVKSIDTEKKLFTAIVLRPNVPDSQGDIYDEDVVEKGCHDYNEHCRQGNLQHLVQTSLMVPVESWISKSDFMLGEGLVLKGDWVMTAKIQDDELWDMCKSGEFTGFSIGCKSMVEVLDDN